VFLSCAFWVAACQFTQANSCPPRPDDATGYLVAICEYLLENQIDVSPGKPQTYNILRIEEIDSDAGVIVVVYLDCCYMGDRAQINKKTGDVLSFQLGDQ